MAPVFFPSAAAFRRWLSRHHASGREIVVGLHRQGTRPDPLTYAAALDEALCFGWIDGVRHRLDETRYTIRFSPRQPGSIWSNVNLRHFARLQAAGRVAPAGQRVFAARDPARSGSYSYEQRQTAKLDPASARTLRANRPAWEHFQSRPPWYRRTATWWVVSAKRPETRARRLQLLISCSARGIAVPPLAAVDRRR